MVRGSFIDVACYSLVKVGLCCLCWSLDYDNTSHNFHSTSYLWLACDSQVTCAVEINGCHSSSHPSPYYEQVWISLSSKAMDSLSLKQILYHLARWARRANKWETNIPFQEFPRSLTISIFISYSTITKIGMCTTTCNNLKLWWPIFAWLHLSEYFSLSLVHTIPLYDTAGIASQTGVLFLNLIHCPRYILYNKFIYNLTISAGFLNLRSWSLLGYHILSKCDLLLQKGIIYFVNSSPYIPQFLEEDLVSLSKELINGDVSCIKYMNPK